MKTGVINFCSNSSLNIKQKTDTVNNSVRNSTPSTNTGNNKQAELKTKNKGVFAGLFTGLFIQNILAVPPGLMITNNMRKVSNISAEENAALSKAADEILTNTSLKDKGVRIIRLAESKNNNPKAGIQLDTQDKALLQELIDQSKEIPLIKFIRNKLPKEQRVFYDEGVANGIKTSSENKYIIPVKLGRNAFYLPLVNKVVTPDKSMQTVIFHELGHALDANGGKITKALFKTRMAGCNLGNLVPMGIFIISLLNRRKVNDKTSENDTKKQKVMDFIKRNAGKLTALILGIFYAEEGLASIRGSQAAKKLVKEGKLTNDLFKKINKTNALGFASYVILTFLTAAAVKVGINIKDKMQEKYEEKQNLKTTQA